jgi:hypothetical protein
LLDFSDLSGLKNILSLMENEAKKKEDEKHDSVEESLSPEEAAELVLFQVSECYVYLIPPRKSAASYRADEWDINKWAWEGILKVISKGEECIIRLEDTKTGELYARAFLRDGEPHPVEPVIDSSRYFVLRVEENIGGRLRHAFIGIGFRERPEAYDFQAALHDHMKYLNKKKTAEEMEQNYQKSSSADYSLKDGETLVLQIKNKSGKSPKSKFFEQGLTVDVKANRKDSVLLQPPPPGPLSPAYNTAKSPPSQVPPSLSLDDGSRSKPEESKEKADMGENKDQQKDAVDEDFGDFQSAG